MGNGSSYPDVHDTQTANQLTPIYGDPFNHQTRDAEQASVGFGAEVGVCGKAKEKQKRE